MAEYIFNPPLHLKGGVLVRTLTQAAAVARKLIVTRLPEGRNAMVRRLENAVDPELERDAANAFRAWAAAEGLLARQKSVISAGPRMRSQEPFDGEDRPPANSSPP